MALSVREYVIQAVVARLTAEVPSATVERSRRAAVNTDQETLPRLVVRVPGWTSDDTQEVNAVHYTATIEITGYAGGDTDAEADQALTALHAATLAALIGWHPNAVDADTPTEQSFDIRLYDADESARPAGEFTASFTQRVIVTRDPTYTFQLDVSALDGDDLLG